ncbi:MAG TPA: TIGR01777 family oxidoreductase [Puia sp.]|nr:TIGR01777 family oxidoreductase [Puia sp.]
MSTILVTGGTGLIGTALTALLIENGHRVIILSRRASAAKGGLAPGQPGPGHSLQAHPELAQWDPSTGTIDAAAISQADYIINLAGAGVADKRWSGKRKKEIEESRVASCATIVKALREQPNNVRAVISSSAIGWYGPDPSIPNPHPFEETAPADAAFLGETCRRWEDAISPVEGLGKRLVIIRTGIVLSKKGGALKEFMKPVRMGVAAILGGGRQVVSWIHIDDLCRLFLHAIGQESWHGPYNGVAPYPVDNRTLMLALARRLKGRYFVPVYIPAIFLKWALGEMSIEVLKSTTVSAGKARSAGFQFLYPTIEPALDQLTDQKS